MDAAALRDDMVAGLEHESKVGLQSERVAGAMRRVRREPFVPDDAEAYVDRSFTCRGSTVLAPSTAARLLDALGTREGEDVLVVGAGVGYTVALLADIAGPERVQAVDIARGLVLEARSNLASAGYEAVLVDRADGAEGLPAYAPYDRILLEAAAVEPPAALLDQLADGGRLVMPLGATEQHLAVVESTGDVERRGRVAFQPMLLEGERPDTVERNRTRREDREFADRSARSRTGWEQEWIDWDRH